MISIVALVADISSSPALLLVDATVRTTVLLVFAAAAAILLRRDSAATRHCVWLLSIAAVLAVPVLSVILPSWKVLPEWANLQTTPAVTAVKPLAAGGPAAPANEVAQSANASDLESPSAFAASPSAPLPNPQSVPLKPLSAQAAPQSNLPTIFLNWNWLSALPFVWSAGFCLLVVRLMLARWVLWNTQRRSISIAFSNRPAPAVEDPIARAFQAAYSQLGIRSQVTLLIHPERAIPMVWGIHRFYLMLPAAAKHWSEEQLQSILLHELAHIRRRDTLTQLLAQVACALHWFNPLVWFAAWRLSVERERACDDLVLASGVRPSAYAAHLLDVVTGLHPVDWTQSCGLAMARKSSLEGRLVAVLSGNLNRRRMSALFVAIALAIAAGIAAPIAMLHAAEPNPAAPAKSELQKPSEPAKLTGLLFVNAGLRTAKDDKRVFQTEIVIDPNSAEWTALAGHSKSGLSTPISPVRVSPDGRTMLFMRDKEVWKCDAATGDNAVRLLEKGEPKAWAPDGKEFIAVVQKDPSQHDSTENWRVSADGKTHLVLPLLLGDVVEDWSTDGGWLVGWSHADGQLYIAKPDGTERKQLTDTEGKSGRNEHPRFSPDGRRIVYLRTLYEGTDEVPVSKFSLRIMNIDGSDDRQIVGETRAKDDRSDNTWTAPMGARWSPDGRHLAVVLFDHRHGEGIMALNGNWRLAIIDADGGNLRELKLNGVLTTVLPYDGPEWRTTAAAPESKQSAKSETPAEEQLQWGEPVNGLRAALVIRPNPRDPIIKDAPEFYLAVQSVSDDPIRLTDTAEAPDLRHLWLRIDGELMAGFGSKDPTGTDSTLKPREIVYLRMFAPDPNRDEKHSTGAVLAEGLLKDTHQSMVGELQIKQAVAGAWTGKLKTVEVTGAVAAGQPQPKDKRARALLAIWQHHARSNGNFPGGLVGRLGDKVQYFIRINTGDTAGDPYAKAMSLLVKRFDATHDWTPAEIVDLLDDVAAVTPIPLETTLEEITQRTFKTGELLPKELANAPWGEPQPSGLRLAWLLEPRAAEYRLGTPLKARILVHNAGKNTVFFRTRTWHQVGHEAHDTTIAKFQVDSTSWTTIGRLMAFRLNPGEFIEVNGPGIGVGKMGDPEDWQQTRVGSWIHAQAGDEVTLTTDPVPLSDWNEKPPADGEPSWWLDFIDAHLAQYLPLPADAEERRRLVYRAGMELFGTPLSANEIDLFVSNREPNALELLAKRLATKPGFVSFTGDLTSGATKFRVLPADPDAAKKPRTATNPGRYTLREGVVLAVWRRGDGERIVNEAKIHFSPPDQAAPATNEQYELKLPDGYNTWAAAWVRGEKTLWLQEPSGLHSYDFSDAGKVEETTYQKTANLESVPKPILDALRAALEPPPALKSTPRTGPPAATAPDSK